MSGATARKFRQLREDRAWSEDDLARRVGVDAATVRSWEGGDAEPDPAALHQLASAFGVSQDELRHREDERHHPGGGA